MKTVVSIPDHVFAQVDALARRTKRSRSQVYARALSEYLARHAPDGVTKAMNRALDEVDGPQERFTSRATRRTLARTDW